MVDLNKMIKDVTFMLTNVTEL